MGSAASAGGGQVTAFTRQFSDCFDRSLSITPATRSAALSEQPVGKNEAPAPSASLKVKNSASSTSMHTRPPSTAASLHPAKATSLFVIPFEAVAAAAAAVEKCEEQCAEQCAEQCEEPGDDEIVPAAGLKSESEEEKKKEEEKEKEKEKEEEEVTKKIREPAIFESYSVFDFAASEDLHVAPPNAILHAIHLGRLTNVMNAVQEFPQHLVKMVHNKREQMYCSEESIEEGIEEDGPSTFQPSSSSADDFEMPHGRVPSPCVAFSDGARAIHLERLNNSMKLLSKFPDLLVDVVNLKRERAFSEQI
ncbi:unnamed protein product [Polarella glacialis]|uniref:Uncharacterized protein n=1 Tax=Polarella glacialis TaxID=89957 RepID=A0A813K857_POLGL|nr:unnamed protein product [Polarella glacialis]